MAARGSALPGVTTALIIEQVIRGYRQALLGRSKRVKDGDVAPVQLVMRRAKDRKWRHLAEERIENVRPEFRGKGDFGSYLASNIARLIGSAVRKRSADSSLLSKGEATRPSAH